MNVKTRSFPDRSDRPLPNAWSQGKPKGELLSARLREVVPATGQDKSADATEEANALDDHFIKGRCAETAGTQR